MLGNWIKATTTVTGTGDLTSLTAVTGFPTFSDVFPTGRIVRYTILDSTGLPIESGIGTLSASGTIQRTKPLVTWVSGVVDDTSPSAVSLAAGTKTVICAAESATFEPAPSGVIDCNSYSTSYWVRAIMSMNTPVSSGTPSTTKDRQYFLPVQIAVNDPIASINCMVGGGSGSGGTRGVRMGIYDMLPSGGPGALLYESGNLTATAYSVMTYSLGGVRLPAGWYYLSIIMDYTSSPALYGGNTPPYGCSPLGIYSGAGPERVAGAYKDVSAGWTAMPNPAATIAGGLAPIYGGTNAPAIWLKMT